MVIVGQSIAIMSIDLIFVFNALSQAVAPVAAIQTVFSLPLGFVGSI
jgi:hypothetical protein